MNWNEKTKFLVYLLSIITVFVLSCASVEDILSIKEEVNPPVFDTTENTRYKIFTGMDTVWLNDSIISIDSSFIYSNEPYVIERDTIFFPDSTINHIITDTSRFEYFLSELSISTFLDNQVSITLTPQNEAFIPLETNTNHLGRVVIANIPSGLYNVEIIRDEFVGFSGFLEVDTTQKSYSVVMEPESFELSFSQSNITMVMQTQRNIDFSVSPSVLSKWMRWESDNEDIVYITDSGRLYAREEGVARISLVNALDQTIHGQRDVTVTGPEINLNITNSILRIGQIARVLVTMNEDHFKSDVTWSTSNPYVAEVDEYGLVTGISEGTATISASSPFYPDVQKSITVIVRGSGLTTYTLANFEAQGNSRHSNWLNNVYPIATQRSTFASPEGGTGSNEPIIPGHNIVGDVVIDYQDAHSGERVAHADVVLIGHDNPIAGFGFVLNVDSIQKNFNYNYQGEAPFSWGQTFNYSYAHQVYFWAKGEGEWYMQLKSKAYENLPSSDFYDYAEVKFELTENWKKYIFQVIDFAPENRSGNIPDIETILEELLGIHFITREESAVNINRKIWVNNVYFERGAM